MTTATTTDCDDGQCSHTIAECPAFKRSNTLPPTPEATAGEWQALWLLYWNTLDYGDKDSLKDAFAAGWNARDVSVQRLKEALQGLLPIAELAEWGTHNAAENTYCPSCFTEEFRWKDQTEHQTDCAYVVATTRARAVLESLK